MVYAACFSPITYRDSLKSGGYNDSKKLKEGQRDSMFLSLDKLADQGEVGYVISTLSAHEISVKMLGRPGRNLNLQSFDTAISMIRKVLDAGVNVKEVG